MHDGNQFFGNEKGSVGFGLRALDFETITAQGMFRPSIPPQRGEEESKY